ncbi:hypothetical protein J7337_007926 [Fusarium musae]|uniref:Ankyrin n=1 Tax=Fusarium musae TaxID=1042133 RepID=A0A9P8DCN8_9HYPO|nr:hypothetical protein J7337_007926 [Fusarium musae]KAG9499470.1 hypothetical protein J7337_007926 [Fusarium musae]
MEAVFLLLCNGAEVNMEGGRYGTALQAACANHGADVHVQSGYFGSVWHVAAAIPAWNRQAHATLRLLLKNGADVNHCHREFGTVLQVAVEHLTSDVEDRIQVLLDNGADANLGAGLYGFPLQSACLAPRDYPTQRLNTGGLVYLVDNCADIDVNQTGGLFVTALQAAAHEGKTEGVIKLLEKGADVNLRGGRYGSSLNAAAVKGYWDIVEILLKAGAKADCYLFSEVDEEWLERIAKEDGCNAVERYRNFWDKVKWYENEYKEAEAS